MTLYEFNTLSDDEKLEAVYETGSFVADIVHGLAKNLLYQLSEFYVEVLYDGKDNLVKGIRSFKQGVYLKPYLEQIDISELI